MNEGWKETYYEPPCNVCSFSVNKIDTLRTDIAFGMLEGSFTRHLNYPSVVMRAVSISDIKISFIQLLPKIKGNFCYKISRKLVESLKKKKNPKMMSVHYISKKSKLF